MTARASCWPAPPIHLSIYISTHAPLQEATIEFYRIKRAFSDIMQEFFLLGVPI